jgi:CheY-like chemotaxis protein
MQIVVAHDSETIREVIRRLLEGVGWSVQSAADGAGALAALEVRPAAMVLDVAVGGVLAYEVVEETRRRSPDTRVVLIASIYNRTGYKRRPTSLYGADDYVEQHHIPDSLVSKLAALIGTPPTPSKLTRHADVVEGRAIRAASEARLDAPTPTRDQVERAERLARLIVADIALYNGDALDHAARTGDPTELDARLRTDLEEGRLLFDLRVPAEVRSTRDFIGEALEALTAQRRALGATDGDAGVEGKLR